MYAKYTLSYTENELQEVGEHYGGLPTKGLICQEIPLQIIRSKRKSLGLQVKDNGQVCARIPSHLPEREVQKFIEKHRRWIIEKILLSKQKQTSVRSTGAVAVQCLTEEEISRIKEKIVNRVRDYCVKMGVTVGKITIRNQKTRWGKL